MAKTQTDFLRQTVQHIDIKTLDVRPLIDQMAHMSFQARNLHRAAIIYNHMLADNDCGIILCLAGSLISAGLKQVVIDMVSCNMVDIIVSTGANIVDQDFFEALGFKHYIGSPAADDGQLRRLHIDRIYDTYISEDELRICDETVRKIADSLDPRPYSSREFIREMGRFLTSRQNRSASIIQVCHEHDVPIFCPAFSDCSAGFGLVMHQWTRGQQRVSIDSARDFLELTRCKLACPTTGLFMVGGGVAKNFAQDVVVAAECLGFEVEMHKYAVQLTVADERDGALSGSTLKEANSWGKVDSGMEQMVYGEATITMPLIVSYCYHDRKWQNRRRRRLVEVCDHHPAGKKPGRLRLKGRAGRRACVCSDS